MTNEEHEIFMTKFNIPLACYIDDYEISIDKVISSDIYLREFIENGDGCFGNWEITVLEIEG